MGTCSSRLHRPLSGQLAGATGFFRVGSAFGACPLPPTKCHLFGFCGFQVVCSIVGAWSARRLATKRGARRHALKTNTSDARVGRSTRVRCNRWQLNRRNRCHIFRVNSVHTAFIDLSFQLLPSQVFSNTLRHLELSVWCCGEPV